MPSHLQFIHDALQLVTDWLTEAIDDLDEALFGTTRVTIGIVCELTRYWIAVDVADPSILRPCPRPRKHTEIGECSLAWTGHIVTSGSGVG